jgi:hypothetical protein
MGRIDLMDEPTTYAERKAARDKQLIAEKRQREREQKALLPQNSTTINNPVELVHPSTELETSITTGPRTNGTPVIEQTIQQKPIRNISGKQLSDTECTEAKCIILDVMGRVWIIKTAVAEAGVSRDTYEYWVSVGYITADELKDAYKRYQDAIREELTCG